MMDDKGDSTADRFFTSVYVHGCGFLVRREWNPDIGVRQRGHARDDPWSGWEMKGVRSQNTKKLEQLSHKHQTYNNHEEAKAKYHRHRVVFLHPMPAMVHQPL